MTQTLEQRTLLIDRYLPEFDTTRREHLVVDGQPNSVHETARNIDLLALHSPLLDTLMWLRTLPEKAGTKLAPSPSMRLGDLFDQPVPPTPDQPWVGLAEERGTELVFGVVGKFWRPSIEWNPIPADRFASFDEPGWGKIAASCSVVPYGTSRTLITYEARTETTDAASRRKLRTYWWLVSPFVGVVMRSLLTGVSRQIDKGDNTKP